MTSAVRELPTVPLVAPARVHLPGLDGLRALAVAFVVVYHVDPDWLPGGFLGVDVFFVISGYLITDLLMTSRGSSLRGFWLRRWRRLVPALVVLTCVVLPVAALTNPRLLAGVRGDALAALTFTGNWWQIGTDESYFATQGRQPLLLHTWSLAVEEQFYLVWPVALLALVWVVRRRWRAAAPVGLAAGSLVAMAVLFEPGTDNSRVYLGTDTHSFGLLGGAALALALPSARLAAGAVPRGWSDALGFGGLAGILAAVFSVASGQTFLYRGGFSVAVLASVAVVVGVVPVNGRVRRVASWAPLRWVGVRSYGIYLWHWPLVVLLSPGLDRLALLVCVAALTVACAAASYRFVERPIRRDGFWHYVRLAVAGKG